MESTEKQRENLISFHAGAQHPNLRNVKVELRFELLGAAALQFEGSVGGIRAFQFRIAGGCEQRRLSA